MGELDRASQIRRMAIIDARIDEHAKVLEAYGKTLTQHTAAIDANYRNLKNDINEAWQVVNKHEGVSIGHSNRLSQIELDALARNRTFWTRLMWLLRGDIPSIRR